MQKKTNPEPTRRKTPEPQEEHKRPADLCRLDGFIATERNRYFTGKYLTARDFQGEQDYFLSRNRLHNRLLHGWGIVCGLEVRPHPTENCRDRYVVVTPGVAIDCLGRELVLRERLVIKVWDPNPPPEGMETDEEPWENPDEYGVDVEEEEAQESSLKKNPPEPPEQEEPPVEAGPFLLVIRYDEQAIEWSPALYSEEACDPRALEANRVRELACVDVHLWDPDRHRGCWPEQEPETEEERRRLRDRCGEPVEPPVDACAEDYGCLDPACACAYGVPLALVRPVYRRGQKDWQIERRSIQLQGRRELPTPPAYLTHVVDTNWKHGRTINLSTLRDELGGALRIFFDRKLLELPDPELDEVGEQDDPAFWGTGVNRGTFVVMYHHLEEYDFELETIYNDDEPDPDHPDEILAPHLETTEETCCAVFPLPKNMLRGGINLDQHVFYVTLKCDFILDCHYHPVDGEHLRGTLPSGDGRPGGTFESWFRVYDDEREKRRGRRQPTGRQPGEKQQGR